MTRGGEAADVDALRGAVLRAQRLLHGLDVSNTAEDRANVLSGLRSEVDTLAILVGMPLRLAPEVDSLPPSLTCDDTPIPFPV